MRPHKRHLLLLPCLLGLQTVNTAAGDEGLYSSPQARRALPVYLKQCSSCHGESFHGGESSPALVGADFMARWNGRPLSDLFAKIRLMPPNDPGRLNVDQTSDVMAAILHANKLPAGEHELPADESQLSAIRLEAPP